MWRCLFVVLLLSAARTASARQTADLHVEVDDSRRQVTVMTSDEFPLVDLSGLVLTYGEKRPFRVRNILRTKKGLHLECQPQKPLASESPRVEMFISEVDGRIRVRYEVGNVSLEDGFKPQNCMFMRRHYDDLQHDKTVVKCGHWVRKVSGGVPVEVLTGNVVRYCGKGVGVRYVYPYGTIRPNWSDGHSQHLPLKCLRDGIWEAVVEIVSGVDTRPDELLASLAAEMPLSIALSTPRTYNWFDDTCTQITFAVSVGAAASLSRRLELSTSVRDFDGHIVFSGQSSLQMPPSGFMKIPCGFSPSAPRGLYFIESRVSDPDTGRSAFSRTNVAHLPRHRFAASPSNSIFGIATYWPIPSEEAVQGLMDRMGVMWIRNGDGRVQHSPRIAYRHTNLDLRNVRMTIAERENWICGELRKCVENGNPAFEFCNELNMSTGGIALEGNGIGHCILAPVYAEWIREIRRIRDERYPGVRLLSCGIAGCDLAFLRKMKELGAWDDLDEIGLHPGRGNFTPDYPLTSPESDRLENVPVDRRPSRNSNFWNYLGTVRSFSREISALGRKPLFLSEVYTPTFPNSWWEDSLRDAADNLVLTYALAVAEGVRCAMYHQLFDGVWHDRCGIDPGNREYHFGLLNRDLSFKPAMMAYCATAEALDGAVFRGWMTLPCKTTHGLTFDTPRGPLAILWDRSDGYVLTNPPAEGQSYASPEPWVKRIGKDVDLTFAATGPVRVGDSIGRYTTVAPRQGKVSLRLDISPRFVYGLDI